MVSINDNGTAPIRNPQSYATDWYYDQLAVTGAVEWPWTVECVTVTKRRDDRSCVGLNYSYVQNIE